MNHMYAEQRYVLGKCWYVSCLHAPGNKTQLGSIE